MEKTIFCTKLKQEAPALERQPFPGVLGEKIHNEISKPAWDMWLSHQTMLINEYRLNLSEAKAREFLKEEMSKYFFGEGSDKPSGFTDLK
jgi:Fe-S cluster biosynthesis and repair protein YggX